MSFQQPPIIILVDILKHSMEKYLKCNMEMPIKNMLLILYRLHVIISLRLLFPNQANSSRRFNCLYCLHCSPFKHKFLHFFFIRYAWKGNGFNFSNSLGNELKHFTFKGTEFTFALSSQF